MKNIKREAIKFPETQFEMTKMLGQIPPQTLNLKANERFLLMQLSMYFDSDFVCYPSLKRLARDTGWSVTTVSANVKRLVASGIIEKHSSTSDKGGHLVNVYRLNRKLFAELTGLQVNEPEQLLSPADSNVNGNEVDRLYAMFIANKPMTKPQLEFLMDGKGGSLSTIESMQLKNMIASLQAEVGYENVASDENFMR